MATQSSLGCDEFIQNLHTTFGTDNASQWISIKAYTDPTSEHSDNLKKTADIIHFEGKNGQIGYSLPLNKFNVHYDCDNQQHTSCNIAFHVAICYSSKESRPIFLSVNNRITECILCQDIIGDFSAKTAEWRLYGPFCIDMDDNEQQNDFINVKFETSGYWPHVKEFLFIPNAAYNLSVKQAIFKSINFEKLIEKNECCAHQMDIKIVDAIKRRSLHKTKSYQNFISNILLYVDCNKDSIKPSRWSKNMILNDNKYIYCDGRNGFIEYLVSIKRSDTTTMMKTYNHEFNLTLGIEYESPDSRPLQLFINDKCKLKDICDETIKTSYDQSAAWRIYSLAFNSSQCIIRINNDGDTFQFTLRLETDGYFPHIKSIMLMEYIEPIKGNMVDSANSESTILNDEEKKEIIEDKEDKEDENNDDMADNSESFLKLATAYKGFITPPSDLISFEPFITSVRNICFDTYFNGPPYTKTDEKDEKDEKNEIDDTEYPDVGITLNNETFIPDPKFFHSRNVDGLWICVSRNCENYQQILDEATFLVKSFIPIEIRRLFLKYKHGRYRRKYVGPMRLIILSHSNNEQAGCIPELKTKETGRNGTAQPFVFSSSDDYNHGFYDYQWFNGRLTAHELVHAVDMVIRQLIDPCFMVECDKIYNLAKQSGKYPEKCYAMTSRHEYIAEILTVFLNIPPKDLYIAGFKNKNDLKERDIDGYQFLLKWFLELNHTLPVLDVYKKCSGTL